MTAAELEAGYWHAYDSFYSWGSILASARTKDGPRAMARHVAYGAGWKKFEPLWDLAIRLKRVPAMLPTLERVLKGFGSADASEARPVLEDDSDPLEGTATPVSIVRVASPRRATEMTAR